MKQLLSAFVFSLLYTTLPLSAELTLTRFNERVYISEDHFYAKENSLVYIGENGVTIIGATWTPQTAELLHAEIQKVTEKPVSSVINTNYHPDRAGGNAYWKSVGAEIYATEQTSQLIESEWNNIMQWTQNSIPDFPQFPATLPTKRCGKRFELEGGSIMGFHIGGSHTPDGIFVYIPEEKILYGGCILKSFLGNLSHADIEAYPQTLRNLKNQGLAISHIIAGHGKPVHGPELIDHYLSLLEQKTQK